MKIYIAGGSKSGKSLLAQERAVQLAAGGPLFYVATMIPSDQEDMTRIERHLEERAGLGFQTLEWGRSLKQHMEQVCSEGTYLVDSVTALLLNEMYSVSWDSPDENAPQRCVDGLTALGARAKNLIYVSDCIGSDAACYDVCTELFRAGLAYVDREVAATCDEVVEVCCGTELLYRGRE